MTQQRTYLGSPEHPGTAAFVCYITIVGWGIAYFWLYSYHRGNHLVRVHLRQSLFLHLATFIVNALLYFLVSSFIVYLIVALLLFVLWCIGVVHAINGRDQLLPVIGSISQRLFSAIG